MRCEFYCPVTHRSGTQGWVRLDLEINGQDVWVTTVTAPPEFAELLESEEGELAIDYMARAAHNLFHRSDVG